MSTAIIVPLQVFGLGFIISLGIAVLIKVMLLVIRKFSHDEQSENLK